MSNYLWKKLSDSERKKLENEAKELILAFGDALENLPKIIEGLVERDFETREEGNGKKCDENFRKLMFENSSKNYEDCIVAEKGSWVE